MNENRVLYEDDGYTLQYHFVDNSNVVYIEQNDKQGGKDFVVIEIEDLRSILVDYDSRVK